MTWGWLERIVNHLSMMRWLRIPCAVCGHRRDDHNQDAIECRRCDCVAFRGTQR